MERYNNGNVYRSVNFNSRAVVARVGDKKMNHDKFTKWLKENGACDPAQEWVTENGYSEIEAWQHCHRADWMLWLAARRPWGDHVKIVRCACACARTALRYVPDGEDRPRLAIQVAERWCENPSEKNVVAARAAAAAASAAAARAGIAASAAAAAYAAAYAAAARDATASAAAASAAAASAAAARAGIAASAAAAAYAAARAAAADAAYAAANAEMAEIVRGIITVEDVARVEDVSNG
jgi:pyruvate/2-oxoglutarate dehydrogenase complex dihydrolipoamide acyltransferase (E2) component